MGSQQAIDFSVRDVSCSPDALRVLFVNDESSDLHALAALLREEGYIVSHLTFGRTVLSAIEADPPDAIFTGVDSPHADGYEFCRALKRNDGLKSIPVLFVETERELLDRQRVFQMGGADYVTVPFNREEVLVRLHHQITIRQQQKLLLQQKIAMQQMIDQLQSEKNELDRQNQHLEEEQARSRLKHQEHEQFFNERQQEDAVMRETEEKYRSIFENAIEGIFQSLPNRRYLQVNPAMAKIYGYNSPSDLIQSVTDMSTIYVQPKRYAELTAYVRIYDEVSEFESQVYRKDGSIIWVSENIRTVRDGTGQVIYFEGSVTDITERRHAEEELRRQRLRAERLLLNVLPQKIAERLKRGHKSIADNFADVSVLFADLVNFTQLSSEMPAGELVTLLNDIFSAFDDLVERYDIEKVKTIGDAYMAVAGMPTPHPNHAEAIANLALDMRTVIQQFSSPAGKPFQLRIGIHTGSVIAGVIGTKKFSYDLWGDTVNVASRMESQGAAGRIQVTEDVYALLRDRYILTPRGAIAIKGKGSMVTYWLDERLPTNPEDA